MQIIIKSTNKGNNTAATVELHLPMEIPETFDFFQTNYSTNRFLLFELMQVALQLFSSSFSPITT